MVPVTVSVEVDALDVVGDMSEGDLRECGVVRIDTAAWDAVASAIRRNEGRDAARLIQKIAFDQGRDLPEFSVARLDLPTATPRHQFAD